MPNMFCPQCGRELELDAGEVRFCRYCGFSLTDTKEALHGYSKHKRTGFAVVTWSYALLALVALSLHEKYVPIETGWGYWLTALLIVVSVSLFVSAALSTLKPQLFSKPKETRDEGPALQGNDVRALPPRSARDTITNQTGRISEPVPQPASVTEGTTRTLDTSAKPRRD